MSQLNFRFVGPYAARAENMIEMLRVTDEFRALEQTIYNNGITVTLYPLHRLSDVTTMRIWHASPASSSRAIRIT